MIFTPDEKSNVQYILPVQGNVKTLELVESILIKSQSEESNIVFDGPELDLLKTSILILDERCLISLQCLSLVKKILNTGER